MNKFFFLFFVTTTLFAKPIIDFRSEIAWFSKDQVSYERPEFIFMSREKNSDTIVLSDAHVSEVDMVRAQGYKKIIAYLMEPRAISGVPAYVSRNIKKFDLVLTFDHYLLQRYPSKCRFIHAFVPNNIQYPQIYEKSKLCSIIYGAIDQTEGRLLRPKVFERYRNFFDGYKTNETPRVEWKDEWLDDFCYSVAIENCQMPLYFTEKILDCFNSGTIPIYWGCPNIGDFFDIEGIIVFNTLEELGDILKNLSFEDYQKRLPAVRRNFELAQKYPPINSRENPSRRCAVDCAWIYIKDFVESE